MGKDIISLLILITFIHAARCQRFSLSQSTGTWEEGLNACRSVQGTLAVVSNVQQQTIFSQQVTTAQLGEKVWVGSYEAYTRNVWIQGCFANMTLPSVRRTKIIEENHLAPCLHECSNTNSMYLGMQGQFCYCFDTIPVNGGNLPGVACQNPCPGDRPTMQAPTNYLSECGSVQGQYSPVSVYRRAFPDEIRLDNTTANIGECFAYNVRTRTWAPRICTTPYGVVCDRINCQGSLQQCIVEIPIQVSWYLARQYCETNTALMSVTNVNTSIYFNTKIVAGDTLYWTGLHRKQKMLWTSDKNTSSLSPSGRCLAVIRNQMGGWTTTIEDCQQRYRYVCFEDLTTTTSTTTTSPTTTTRTTSPWARPSTPSLWNPWTTTKTDTATFLPVNVTEPSSAKSHKLDIIFFLATILTFILI